MYGSTERKSVRSRICPFARAGIGASTRRKSDSFGIPTGRAANVNWRLTVGSGLAVLAVIVAALCQSFGPGEGCGATERGPSAGRARASQDDNPGRIVRYLRATSDPPVGGR